MSHFYSPSQKVLDRVRMFQEEIALQSFHAEPCRLLKSQLEETLVLTERLQANIRKLLAVSEMQDV